MDKKKEPANTIKIGRIKAKIWENRDKRNGGTWFNTEIVRIYKEDDKWQESTQFGVNDLPLVTKAADLAFAWIYDQRKASDREEDREPRDDE
jgi:hypothetical protein